MRIAPLRNDKPAARLPPFQLARSRLHPIWALARAAVRKDQVLPGGHIDGAFMRNAFAWTRSRVQHLKEDGSTEHAHLWSYGCAEAARWAACALPAARFEVHGQRMYELDGSSLPKDPPSEVDWSHIADKVAKLGTFYLLRTPECRLTMLLERPYSQPPIFVEGILISCGTFEDQPAIRFSFVPLQQSSESDASAPFGLTILAAELQGSFGSIMSAAIHRETRDLQLPLPGPRDEVVTAAIGYNTLSTWFTLELLAPEIVSGLTQLQDPKQRARMQRALAVDLEPDRPALIQTELGSSTHRDPSLPLH
jgi:hypothetical protein